MYAHQVLSSNPSFKQLLLANLYQKVTKYGKYIGKHLNHFICKGQKKKEIKKEEQEEQEGREGGRKTDRKRSEDKIDEFQGVFPDSN